MALGNKILSLFKPTIQLEEIAIKDSEKDNMNDEMKPSKFIGSISPYIKINGYVFDHTEILDMVLSETGFLPTLRVTLIDTKGIFKSSYFPKVNPILSLYIRSKHDKLKCVRCDFLVTNVTSDSSEDDRDHDIGKNTEFVFSGILMVPNIYSNAPQSYSKLTSYEVLQSIASDMKLGFASNEDYTNDRMTWIKPLASKSNFIQHIILRSFKDDKSFYMGFIDKYYHLNFINVASMFSEDGDFDKVYENILTAEDMYKRQSDTTLGDATNSLVLTNMSKSQKTDLYLQEHRPNTTSGSKLIKSGYVRSVSYYDQQLTTDPKKNIVLLDIRPISATLMPGGKNKKPGDIVNENLEMFASNLSYGEWCGIDYNNGHDNFNYAQIQNEHNNGEIRKVTLYVRLDGMNLNIIRGMRVPVVIVRENASEIVDAESNVNSADKPKNDVEKDDTIQIVKDKWLSGYYVVGDLTYTYEEGKFITEATLLRMNWSEKETKMP